MDLRVLRYFLMTAREENVTRAAQLLHITQPTLSRQLAQLEKELGVELFRRGRHSVCLTGEGLLFRRRAQELLELAERARSELSQTEEELSGTIVIGSGEFLSVDELSEMIAAFQKEHRQVRFDLRSGNNSSIIDWIERGMLDIGLLLEPVDLRKFDFVRMKQTEQWGVLVRKDSPLAGKKAVRPGDLCGLPVVTANNEAVYNELASWSGGCAAKMSSDVSYNLLYNAAMVTRKKGSAAVCIRLNCTYPDLEFIPLEPKLELYTVLAWKDQQPFSKTARSFIKFVKEYNK